jgi:hypothetical protein
MKAHMHEGSTRLHIGHDCERTLTYHPNGMYWKSTISEMPARSASPLSALTLQVEEHNKRTLRLHDV